MTERLTRSELGWLLAQEARSASQRLLQGVTNVTIGEGHADESSSGVESTLARLDETVTKLAQLHGQPTPRGRRGRIDLAALVWEIAPEARVQIEMGEGTSVYGDEAELRRMLHVLIGQTGDPTGLKGAHEIFIRREGDLVRVGANLGPDASMTFETERAWLSRMATRYGGRMELDGLVQTLVLPADNDDRSEVATLRRELAAAQAQGVAIARELAAAQARSDRPSQVPATDALVALIATSRALSVELRGILSAVGREMAPLRDREDEVRDVAESVSRHLTAASEVVSDLARLGSCPLGELPRHADVVELVREVVRHETPRALRHDVKVVVTAPASLGLVLPTGGLQACLHALLEHALFVSPPSSTVTLTVVEGEGDAPPVIHVDDAGPSLSSDARVAIARRDLEVLSHGRTARLPLLSALAISAHYGMRLDVPDGASEAPAAELAGRPEGEAPRARGNRLRLTLQPL